jgi:hypothetical protein
MLKKGIFREIWVKFSAGVDMNIQNKAGDTPIHCLFREKNFNSQYSLKVVLYILTLDFNPNIQNG